MGLRMKLTYHGVTGTSIGYPRIKQRWVRFQTRYLSDLDPLDGSPGHLFWNLSDQTQKDPESGEKQGLSRWYVRWMSVLYDNHLHARWFLTYQMNIYRDVWSGFCWMFSTNCTIDFLIRSLGLILNSVQMVSISSLRVSGILRQVWNSCFLIIIGSPYYLWVVVKVPWILVRSSGRVTLDCLTFISAFFIYSSFDASTDWWNALDSRLICRDSISFCCEVFRFCSWSRRMDTSRETSGLSMSVMHLFIRVGS